MHLAGEEKATLDMDEVTTVDAVGRYGLLESEPDEVYQDIIKLASLVCSTPIAAVAIFVHDRQCVKCSLGLSVTEAPRDAGFALQTITAATAPGAHSSTAIDIIDDTFKHTHCADNSWVIGQPKIRFYAGVALLAPTGEPMGVLFVADTKPRDVPPGMEAILVELGAQLVRLLESRVRTRELEAVIAQQRKEEDDLKSQVEQIHSYSRELQVHAVRLEAINARLEALAKLDGMTGLKNHRAFQERLEFEFQRAVRYSMPLSLLLLDVDSFKQFNDTFGHLAGDEVLKTVAQVLQENARGVDFVARYGGEEFVVILPHADEAAAFAIGERLRSAIEGVVWPLRSITASFGIATLTPSMTHANDLIALSDKALYGSKTAGRNRVMHVNDMGVEAK